MNNLRNVKSSKIAVIRCEAAPHIGGGHVMRCLNLAEELQNRGWHCVFATSPQSLLSVPALKESRYDILSPDGAMPSADLVVVDHYDLGERYESSARQWAKHVAVIDDLADRQHDCDILMDQTYGREASDYKPLVPVGCRILTGAEYALLNLNFVSVREEVVEKRHTGEIEKIVSFFSVSDPLNASCYMLDALEALDHRLHVDLVLSKDAENYGSVVEKAEQSKHTIVIHSDVRDMASLMKGADLVVGAGGISSWERCCLGLPSIVIEIADNQAKIARELEKSGAILFLGKLENLKATDLTEKVEYLLHHPEHLISMRSAAFKVCDGKGAPRFCDEIERLTTRVA